MAKDQGRFIYITKEFDFDAAHVLDKCGLPEGHKCTHLHGHTYRVVVALGGNINEDTGMLVDYADIAAAWQPLHAQLDHKFLNDIEGLRVSTTENLVHWILQRLMRAGGDFSRHLRWVRVYESSTTYAEAATVHNPAGR